MRNRVLGTVCTVLSVILVVLLCFGVKNFNVKQKENAAVYNEYAAKLSVIESRKKEAEAVLYSLEKKIEDSSITSTLSLIACGMSEDIYNVLFPVTEQYGIKCTIVMTGDRLPGRDGILNDEQILELHSAGWKLIPGYSEGDGNDGITSSVTWLNDYGYDYGGAVFIESEALTEERKALLEAEGFTTVIVDVGAGGTDHITLDPVANVWYPFAMGYSSEDPKKILNTSIEQSGSLIFTVGFENEWELYEEKEFSSMLSYLWECERNGTLSISDTVSARQYRAGAEFLLNQVMAEISAEKAENDKIIEDAEKEIASLYESRKKIQ